MHGSERWTPEEAESEAGRLARENMAAYCNVYEAIAGAEARIRATRDAIRQMQRAEARVARWFTPETLGLDEAGIAAAVRALREADSRKSLPLARAFLTALPPEARPGFGELKNATLPEIQRLAIRWIE